MANGGVASPTDPIAWQGHSVDEMQAAVQEAADAQTYVSAHLYTAGALPMAYGTDLLGEMHARQSEEFAIRSRVLPAAEIFGYLCRRPKPATLSTE